MRPYLVICLAGLVCAGCYSSTRLSRSRAPSLPPESFVGLYLESGARLRLDNAQYVTIKEGLLRLARIGIPDVHSLDQVDVVEMRTSRPQSVRLEEIGDRRIMELVLRGNEVVIFNEEGGRLDSDRQAIMGTLLEGDGPLSEFRLNEIREIRIERPKVLVTDDEAEGSEQFVHEIISREDGVLRIYPHAGDYVRGIPAISGRSRELGEVTIPTESIKQIEILEFSPEKTTLAVAIPALVVGVGAAVLVTSSCPFVYSHDGEEFVLDAEPLGGATVEVFKRTDFSRLDHLRASDGTYEILVRNAKNETQFIDEIKLIAVDHPHGTRIVSDPAGTLHALSSLISPTRAVDERGRDIAELVVDGDDRVWLSAIEVHDRALSDDGALRHTLTFEFPKPPDADEAFLVVNAGLSPWGADMVRKLLELRGGDVDAWYDAMNRRSPELMKMWMFLEREELFFMKAYVQKGETWVPTGFIAGGGPIVTEDRLLTVDLRDVAGDVVRVRIHPPAGQWKLDFVGLTFENGTHIVSSELVPHRAVDQNGQSRLGELQSTDDVYYVMPEPGDYARLSFKAPPARSEMERTILLKTAGYYNLHLPKDRPAQHALLEELMTEPGRVVQYSLEEYKKSYGGQTAVLP